MEAQYLLTVKSEEGNNIVINVLDVITSIEFNKTYILYNKDDEDTIYTSILNEDEYSYLLEKITNEEELNFINKRVKIFKEKIIEQENIKL